MTDKNEDGSGLSPEQQHLIDQQAKIFAQQLEGTGVNALSFSDTDGNVIVVQNLTEEQFRKILEQNERHQNASLAFHAALHDKPLTTKAERFAQGLSKVGAAAVVVALGVLGVTILALKVYQFARGL